MILAVAALGAFFMIVLTLANRYNLNIKDKTVGHGQHGTARWASRKEIRRTYKHLHFNPQLWRKSPKSRPKDQGIVVGCKTMRRVRFANLFRRVIYLFRKIIRFFQNLSTPTRSVMN